MLQKTEEKHKVGEKSRIKFVETSGVKFKDYFKATTISRDLCKEEEKCMACKNPRNRIDCKKSNIGYSLDCILCKKRKILKTYQGESSRNSYLRQKEHKRELEKESSKSVMWKHIMKEHPEEKEEVDFEMRIVAKFSDSLSRQIHESLRIRNTAPSSLLNSKAEFYGPCVKRKTYDS